MKSFVEALLVISLFLLLGCSTPTAATTMPTPSEPINGTPVSPEPTIGTPEACRNPLYPVRANGYWRYAVQSIDIGSYDITHTINAVSESGFSVTLVYSTGLSVTQNWTCSGGDLLVMDAPGGASGSLVSSQTFTEFHSDENSGVTLPCSVAEGDMWEQDMRASSQVSLPDGMSGSGEGWYNASYQAMGRETVTVPAGTFDALVIMVYPVFDLTVSVDGMEIPVPVEMMGMLWYAEGVGLVKSEINSTMGGSETLELTSYFLP